MTEPLKQIPFTIAGRLAMGDVFRYLDPHVFVTHQFGFLRANVFTGKVEVIVGIGYQNPVFPPSNIGAYINGDFNQSVTELAASDEWIVLDNIAPSSQIGKPSALVWKNGATLAYHGHVPQAAGYWWDRAAVPVLAGDLLTVKNDRGSYDVINVREKQWTGHATIRPPDTSAKSVGGYAYRWIPLDGSGQSRYALVRSDVAVEQPPIQPPVVTPPPPVVTPPTVPPGTPPPGTPPPYTPPVVNPPTTGYDLRLGGRFNVTCRWTAAGYPALSPALAWKIPFIDGGYFTFFGGANPEIFVKYADLTSLPGGQHGLSFAKATTVDFVLTITDLRSGGVRTVLSSEIPVPKWAWFS